MRVRKSPRQSPRQSTRRDFASTDYTAGITLDFNRKTEEESIAAQYTALPVSKVDEDDFEVKLPSMLQYRSSYDLITDEQKLLGLRKQRKVLSIASRRRLALDNQSTPPSRWNRESRKESQKVDATLHRKTNAGKISTREKYAQERAARKVRSKHEATGESSRYQEERVAAQESAKEERERRKLDKSPSQIRDEEEAKEREAASLRKQLKEDEERLESQTREQEARRLAAALLYQQQVARREKEEQEAEQLRKQQAAKMERDEIQRARREEAACQKAAAELAAKEREEAMAYTERNAAIEEDNAPEDEMPLWMRVELNRKEVLRERFNPPALWSPENNEAMLSLQRRTTWNTTVNETRSREQLETPEKKQDDRKSQKTVRYILSPNSGLEAVQYKEFHKTMPSTMLESSDQPWFRKDHFQSRWTDRFMLQNHQHPSTVPPSASYGLDPQYDDYPPDVQDPYDTSVDMMTGEGQLPDSGNAEAATAPPVDIPFSIDVEMTDASPPRMELDTSPTINGAVNASSIPSANTLHGSINPSFNGLQAPIPMSNGDGDETTSTNGLQNAPVMGNGVETTSSNTLPNSNAMENGFQDYSGLRLGDNVDSVPAEAAENPTDGSSQLPASVSAEDGSTAGPNGGSFVSVRENPGWGIDDLLGNLEVSGKGIQKFVRIREAKRVAREAAEAARKAAEEEERRKVAAVAKAKADAKEAARIKAEEEAAEAAAKAAEEERLKGGRRIPTEKFVCDLSPAWAARLDEELRKGPRVTTLSGAELSKHDFDSLAPRTFLNDEIINAHLEQTVNEANQLTGEQKFVTQNSFFYSNLSKHGPAKVARWMKRKKAGGEKLLELDAVFIPVNKYLHWTLIVVSPKAKTIEYFDSLGGSSVEFVRNIRNWLEMELGPKYVADEWTVPSTPCTRQRNGYDCGVFLVTNAKCISLGLDPTCYGAEDMTVQRLRIAAEIINGGSILD